MTHPLFTPRSSNFACVSLMDQWRWLANDGFYCIALKRDAKVFIFRTQGCRNKNLLDLIGLRTEPTDEGARHKGDWILEGFG